ncbi:hypothetical protein FIV42_22625 [Persicimonas caeni]|uniref:non-specific serine/threonine protein kinase n=1 Tax=Persicimonas caeni TaxID=2292766 RepID=A0A4Y6PYN6_PERCE|nr:serine/threonine-protein kinase [Persicimonas caeni]QDG53436.1 hypothetical protein FIV42_22625 [Persicimonas caeni]QED34657.1 protein kinase [Persicimonas caeni]
MLEVGSKLVAGRFELVRQLGEGGMGVVYEAIDQRGGGRVALKTVHRLDGRSLYRFKREFRALEDIQHPNLVQLRELHREDDLWFFTMELVKGEDFRTYVARTPKATPIRYNTADLLTTLDSQTERLAFEATLDEPPGVMRTGFDEARLRGGMSQLVDALDALHRAGRVHRDVKPSNVLVTAQGRVVLLDFGLIAEFERIGFRPASRNGFSGTLRYMAPEQASDEEVGPAADLYAVGVMLYEILCGRPPFDGPAVKLMLKKRLGDYVPAVEASSGAPRDLLELCDALMRPDPESRPTAAEVLEVLSVGARSQRARLDAETTSDVFVGRQAELDALEGAWAAVRDEGAVSVIVEGEAGVGKSALVRRFVEQRSVDSEALLLLYGRCYERESVPYKGLDRVVDDLTRFLDGLGDEVEALLDEDIVALARIFPVLSQVRPIYARLNEGLSIRNPREIRRRGFAALKSLLARVAEQRPLMVVIDDLQWADADSLALLSELVDPPDAPRMLLLATRRPGHRSIELPGEVRQLSLSGLQRDEVEALMRSLDDGSVGDEHAWSADALTSETGGHPLFVQQLVQHMAGSTSAKGVGLEEVLWRRINEMPNQARLLIEIVAVAGVPLDVHVLSTALGVGLADGVEIARQAQTAMLLRIADESDEVTVEAYHDRVREAASRFMDPEERRFYHARLAHALEVTELADRRPHLMLRHLEGADEEQRAARFAVQAAEQAAEAMAFERAAELYRQALRIGDYAPSKARDLELELARALSNAGLGLEAAEIYLAAVESVPPDQRLVLERRAAEELMTNGDVERGMSLIDSVLEEICVPQTQSTFATICRVIWLRLVLLLVGLRPRRSEPDAQASQMRQRIDILATLGRRLALIDTLRGFEFQSRELRLALRYGTDHQLAAALATEATYQSSSGTTRGIERGEQVLVQARELAAELQDPWLDHYIAMQWGIICFFADRFRVAVDTLEEAVEWFASESPGDQYLVNSGRLFMMFALRHLGEIRKMSEHYEAYARDARHRNDRLVLTTIGTAANTYWLFAGDPAGATRQLDEADWVPPERSVHLQHWFEFVARAEIAIYEDRALEFWTENRKEIRRLARNPVIWAARATYGEHFWAAGRLHAAAVDGGADPQEHSRHLRRIVRKLAGEDSKMVQLWSRMLEAAAEAIAGDSKATIAALERTITHAEKIEMKICEMAARGRLAEILAQTGNDPVRQARLRAEVDAWMQAEGVGDPQRLLQLYMPGFGS